ncbi:hypothetical protein [Burkholderia vietnamiensis]|uniref:hypothetical protein n=1 Tax=Burkholderia vietnamiensis TaxID=60552 RepID=UPI001D158659|nr:hypothetical protein [Burkholderia vietnamiensis]UEC01674.1 hypothetical protein LK462_06510 [Burkholderia vietnamiensis]
MSANHVPAAPQPPLNELARAVVELPLDATLYSSQHFIAIVWDDGPSPGPSILGAEDTALPYFAPYQLVSRLCGDRAMRAVDGALRVRQRTLAPETYLGLWRSAMQAPLTPQDLASRFGLKILVTLGAALAPARLASRVWTSSPFESFLDFEAAYGARFVLGPTASGASGFELTLDLCAPQAARDAFYGRALVTDRQDAEGQVHTSLVPTGTGPCTLPDGSPQNSLFEENAA